MFSCIVWSVFACFRGYSYTMLKTTDLVHLEHVEVVVGKNTTPLNLLHNLYSLYKYHLWFVNYNIHKVIHTKSRFRMSGHATTYISFCSYITDHCSLHYPVCFTLFYYCSLTIAVTSDSAWSRRHSVGKENTRWARDERGHDEVRRGCWCRLGHRRRQPYVFLTDRMSSRPRTVTSNRDCEWTVIEQCKGRQWTVNSTVQGKQWTVKGTVHRDNKNRN
jgi:hypothetical protein